MSTYAIDKCHVQIVEQYGRFLLFDKKHENSSVILRQQHNFACNIGIKLAAVRYATGSAKPQAGRLLVVLTKRFNSK
jgi:hypothetical protein